MDWNGKERRKKILVEKKFQLRYTALLTVSFLVILILVEVHLYSFLRSALPRMQFDIDHSYIIGLGIIIMIEMLVIIFVVGLIDIIYSNKFIGPLVRLTKELDEMSITGKYHHIKIRKKDEVHGLTKKINELIDKISK